MVSVTFSLVLASIANAAQPLMVKPWIYDPDNTGIVNSGWVPKQGLPDAGGSNHALYLQKAGETTVNASAGATVTFQGKITELGFDYRNDGWCGAGAPRFNVVDQNGVYHFFGCDYGVHTPIPGTNWTRVRFTGADAFPPLLPTDTAVSVDIVFDEGTTLFGEPYGTGFTYLDNIDVNGTLVGKPGAAK